MNVYGSPKKHLLCLLISVLLYAPIVVAIGNSTSVVGMGPAGLLSAYHQLQLGHRVTIIEGRADPFTRNRRTGLSPSFLRHITQKLSNFDANGYKLRYPDTRKQGDYAFKMVLNHKLKPVAAAPAISSTDQDIVELIIKEHGIISIQAVQKYLLQKIQDLVASGKHPGASLEIIKPATVIDVDQVNGLLILSDGAAIPFDHLIIAEGGSRKLSSKLFADLGKDLKIESLPLLHSAQYSYGIVSINLKNANAETIDAVKLRPVISPFINNSSVLNLRHLKYLKTLGWNKDILPIVYIQYLTAQQQFYFSCETPEEWSGLPVNELSAKLQRFAEAVIKIEHPYLKHGSLELATINGRSSATTFISAPNYISSPYVELKNNRHVFVIGDALFESNFLFGHGLKNAAASSYAVAQSFDSHGNFVSAKPTFITLKSLRGSYLKNNYSYKALLYLNKHPVQKEFALALRSNLARIYR